MKVLVTGATGMLGRSLVRALEAADHQVLGLGRVDADVRRLASFRHPIQALQPDWIFHLAGFTKVDECETRTDEAYLVNALGSRNAAQAAAEANASLLAISTDYVFDGLASQPYREYDPTGPRTVYGQTKLAGEQAIREVHPRHVIVRTSWLYGRGGTNFIDTILRKARAGESLAVVADQRGSPTWTRDLAPILVLLAESGQYGTYHASNAGDCTWWDLADYAVRKAGLGVPVEKTTTAALGRPAPRPSYSVLNTQMVERVTGQRLPHWHDAVDRYLESRVHAT